MKKALKVLGTIVKVYVVLNTLCWAWIGVGQLLKKGTDDPSLSPTEVNEIVVGEAIDNWKMFFKV